MRLQAGFAFLCLWAFASAAIAGCPSGSRFAGTITEPRGQVVQVGRSGARIQTPGGFGAVCTGDLIFAETADVTIVLAVSPDTPMTVRRGQTKSVPGALDYWLLILRDNAPFFERERAQAARTTGSLGGAVRLGFGVAGLGDGSAQVELGGGPLVIPIIKAPVAAQATLIDPAGRRFSTRSIAADDDAVVFPQPQMAGVWRVEIASEESIVEGRFTVVPVLEQPNEIKAAALSPGDKPLALSCFNITRYGLEAFQQLYRLYGSQIPIDVKSTLLRWSGDTSDTFCAYQPISSN